MDWYTIVLAVLSVLTAAFQWLKARKSGAAAAAATSGVEAFKQAMVAAGKADVAKVLTSTIASVAAETGAAKALDSFLASKGINVKSVIGPALLALGGGPPGGSGPRV